MNIIEEGHKIRNELKSPENRATMEMITMRAKNFADVITGKVPDCPVAISHINDVLTNVGVTLSLRERGGDESDGR